MRVGIQLPEVERVVPWRELVAIARAAEDAGFESLWLGDHLLYRDERGERGPHDAWTQLAALAAVTTRMRLGPLVAAAAFHPPGLIARMAASIDEISGGRFVLGIGAGWNEPEFRAFGVPFDHLASRFEESFTIVRRLLAGERVTFAGRYHVASGALLLPKPTRRVPLMVGSTGERVLTIALPHVDAWNAWYSWYDNTPEGFARLRDRVDRISERAGRPPHEVAPSACVLVRASGPSERAHERPPVPVDRLADHLRALADAGADETILVVDPITEHSVRELALTLGPIL